MEWRALPKELVPKETVLPGKNDCRTNLSPIWVVEDNLLVPNDLWEDAELFDSELEPESTRLSSLWWSLPKHSWKSLRAERKKAYRACRWYEELVRRNVPTAPGILLEPRDWNETLEFLRRHVSRYPFVRTCRASPKDVCSPTIFSDPSKARWALETSARTKLFRGKGCCSNGSEGCHLFLRQTRTYEWECRCFWTKDRLRAVSLPEYPTVNAEQRASIVEFFRRHGPDLPYHSAVIDLGLICVDSQNLGFEIIEFNQFGPDMNAGAGSFSWLEDAATLSSSPETVFRPD